MRIGDRVRRGRLPEAGRGGDFGGPLGQLHRKPKQLLPLRASHRRPTDDDQLRRRQHFGDQWGGDWVNQNVYAWNAWGARPLYDRMMDVEQYRTRLGWYIRELLDSGFDGSSWLQHGNALVTMCTSAAIEDTYRTLDYGFDNNAFLNCLTTAWGGHVSQGIASYVNDRNATAYAQTADAQFPRDIQAWAYTPVVDDTLRVKAEAAGTPTSVQLHYSVDGAPFQVVPMNDDGMSGDGLAGDGRHGLKLHFPSATQVSWYASATYSDEAQPTDPCVPQPVWISYAEDVPFRLNEVMALNGNFITDEAGGYADWVEIVHVGEAPASVTGLRLTDRRSEPNRYAFPAFVVDPGITA